jgi:hypothetical protein
MMKKTRWFWGTLLFWALFSLAVTGRALIYSQLNFDPKVISRYEIHVNGLSQSNQFWVNEGNLTDLLPLLERHYKQEGWIPCLSGKDLLPDLFQLEGLVPDISDQFQIKMFQKPGCRLALGLLQSSDSPNTYGWEGVLPDACLSLEQERKAWNLPFPAPLEATQLISERLENLEFGIALLNREKDLTELFKSLCLKEQWKAISLKTDPESTSFLITKGNEKLLAVLSHPGRGDAITFVKLKIRKAFL